MGNRQHRIPLKRTARTCRALLGLSWANRAQRPCMRQEVIAGREAAIRRSRSVPLSPRRRQLCRLARRRGDLERSHLLGAVSFRKF
jgi:hypothetical protein